MKFYDNDFFMIAKTFHGLEEVLISELEAIGAKEISKLKRAVKFFGNNETLYKANLLLRTAVRILKPIHLFRVRDEKDLYVRSKEIPWHDILSPNSTFMVSSTVNSENFNHANYVALKVKDAIVDKIRNKEGARPSIDKVNPDFSIHVHISHEDCEIYMDSSGDSLHKRGWRLAQTEAPLSEILAAGMIMLSGWDKDTDFLDPMCGSGTLPIEAAMIATNTPAGFFRDFAFQKWQDFDEIAWKKILDEAKSNIIEPKCKIYGRDISPITLQITRKNIEKAGFDELITVSKRDFFKDSHKEFQGTIIMNPPYGERLKIDDIIDFYRNIGDALKQHYKNSSAWVLSSDVDAIKNVGLKPSRKMQLFNGKLECKYHRFDLY